MATLATYAPNQILATLGGIPLTGFETGTFITIAKTEDEWTVKSGINGDAMRVQKVNLIYSVEFTMMFSSPSNDYLSALANADSSVPGSGMVPLSVTNGLGRDTFAAPSAWVVKLADTGYSDAGDPKVWTINAHNAVYFPGGS